MTKTYKRYYTIASVATLLCASYPIYMVYSVLNDMIWYGTVAKENYPKYIIPYAPIAAGLMVAVLIMPLFRRLSYTKASLSGAFAGTAVFFIAEFYLESRIIIAEQYPLEDWQMFMCYIPPSQTATRLWTPVNILMGAYSPAFKIHFYLISVVLVAAVVRVLYGFGHRLLGDRFATRRSLITQTCAAVLLFGLCLLACFTAFFRDGELTVSPLSAVLMALFFVSLGVTFGSFVGSFLVGKRQPVSVGLPALCASLTVLMMYIGETFLLSGHLYRLGEGVLFEPLGIVPFSVVDMLIILAAGVVTALLVRRFYSK